MIILMGASASGKTEVAKLLQINYDIKKVITHTTRGIRINEINHIDYHFVNKDEFLLLKDEDFFVETTCYNGNYYGTSKKEISDDKCIVLDPNGAESFLKLNDDHIFVVYLVCSEITRKNRMYLRKDSEDKIIERLNSDRKVFTDELKNISNLTINSENKEPYIIAKEIIDAYKDHLDKISR